MSVLAIENNSVYRMFDSSERYAIDFPQEGLEQSDQDGWYFGVWVNRRKILYLR